MTSKQLTVQSITPYAGAPTLAWLIAKQVTGKRALDVTILITGKKGSGKSYFSLSLAREISKCITIINNSKELKALSGDDRKKLMKDKMDKLFNMNHVRAIDKDGTLQMFSGDIVRTKNSVLLCDDVSIAANSRNAMTNSNKALSNIITIIRPYRNVLILNTVYSSLIDKVVRGFSDIVIELLDVDEKNNRSIAKVYLYSVNQNSGKEYKKFYTYKGMRIKYWICYLPPVEFTKAYDKLRQDKTDEHLDLMAQQQIEREAKSQGKGGKAARKSQDIINTYKDKILGMYYNGESMRAMTRISPEMSVHYVNKILAMRDPNITPVKKETKNVRKE